MDPSWIFPLFCIGMMLLFIFSNKDTEQSGWCCMPQTTQSTREQELEKEIENLKEEIKNLKN